MELRWINQQIPGAISVRDEVELVNCSDDSGYTNGEYMVAGLEADGEVTLIGKDNTNTASMVAVVHLDLE